MATLLADRAHCLAADGAWCAHFPSPIQFRIQNCEVIVVQVSRMWCGRRTSSMPRTCSSWTTSSSAAPSRRHSLVRRLSMCPAARVVRSRGYCAVWAKWCEAADSSRTAVAMMPLFVLSTGRQLHLTSNLRRAGCRHIRSADGSSSGHQHCGRPPRCFPSEAAACDVHRVASPQVRPRMPPPFKIATGGNG